MTGIEATSQTRRLLADATAAGAAARAAECPILRSAAAWASAHPATEPEGTATMPIRGADGEIPLTGAGVPAVDTRCLAEFAAALELSTTAGAWLMAEAVELAYRLPRLWQLVVAGRVPGWRARQVAQQTVRLAADAAEFVDAQVAAVTGRVTPTALRRLIETALVMFDADELARRLAHRADPRRAGLQLGGADEPYGHLDAVLDLPDALDLDAALEAGAEQLLRLGCTEPRRVRRALALSDLARPQATLPIDPDAGDEAPPLGESVRDAGRVDRPHVIGHQRQVALVVHISADSLAGGEGSAVAHLERNGLRPYLADRVRAWCQRPEVALTVRPVIDLNIAESAAGYAVPDRIVEHVRLRDRTCVFPWCASRRTDIDHIVAYDHRQPHRGGQTHTDNLAPLCRRHHRLKTFAGWAYVREGPGRYRWTSPYGRSYLRDVDGGTSPAPAAVRPSGELRT